MSSKHAIDEPVYPTDRGKLSVRGLLEYFEEVGTLRASDLHLKVGCPPIYRMDGELRPIKGPPLDAAMAEALIAGMLEDAELDRLARERSIDSSYITERLQFRINVFHDNDGIAAAVRALDSEIMPVEALGFPNNVWCDVVAMKRGLVLVTGITGAGKSTTIASLIRRIADTRPCRIITLEDPIEYRLRNNLGIVSQREVGRDVPSFERGLRDCLREDPDVIFVGEMRDRVSAAWTLTAAETGHLVFSTLHTRDARGTITRVLDMFPEGRRDEVASQLSLGLRYVVSQKLVPRADGEGRAAAMEIMNNTYAIANLIRVCKVEQIYSHIQTRTRDVTEERMCTMERSLAMLVKRGVVAPLEAEKWAEDRNSFLDEMQQIGAGPAA